MLTWDEWYKAFKIAAAAANPQLRPNSDGRSALDWMDHAPLRRAFQDGVDPKTLGQAFASQFDINTFGRR